MYTPKQLLVREVTYVSMNMVVVMLIIIDPSSSGLAWLAFGLGLATLIYLNIRVRRVLRQIGEDALEREGA